MLTLVTTTSSAPNSIQFANVTQNEGDSATVSSHNVVNREPNRVELLQDTSVTSVSSAVANYLQNASLPLIQMRNKIVDASDRVDAHQILELTLIDQMLDEIENAIYKPTVAAKRLERSAKILKQSAAEIEHCRQLLEKRDGKTKKNA